MSTKPMFDKTFLADLEQAQEQWEESVLQQSLARLGATDITPAEVQAIQDVFVRTGARDQVELDIAHFVRDARAAIEAAPLTDEACDLLDQLALYVAWRDR